MLSATIALAVFGLLALLWAGARRFLAASARAAAELAAFYGRRACGEAGVQWLDHTAILERITLRRDSEGRLRWLRRYRFEYSQRGEDRQRFKELMIEIGLKVPASSVVKTFDQAKEALAYLEKGRAKGKVVVQMK